MLKLVAKRSSSAQLRQSLSKIPISRAESNLIFRFSEQKMLPFSTVERTHTSKRFASSTSIFEIDAFDENTPTKETSGSSNNHSSSGKSSEKDMHKETACYMYESHSDSDSPERMPVMKALNSDKIIPMLLEESLVGNPLPGFYQ